MAAFGWSTGDLVASIKIVIKIAGTLTESGGAKAEFQEAVEEIANSLNTFFKEVEKFNKSLGTESKMRTWRTARRKLQDVNKLRKKISTPMVSLSISLETQNL
jgi:hypothetical protein